MAKFKVGDKVRIVSEWCDGCQQNPLGKMDKWLGKVMTIRELTKNCGQLAYYMEEDYGENYGRGWAWNEKCIAGLACECKFKVGERYKVGDNALVEAGNTIKITDVDNGRVWYKTIKAVDSCKVSDDFHEDSSFAQKLIPISDDEETIIITRKGNKTYAKYYLNDECMEKAVARCHPNDEYTFKEGAKLAFNRLIGDEHADAWKKFTDGTAYVEVTKDNVMDFLKACEERGYCWGCGYNATEWNPFDHAEDGASRLCYDDAILYNAHSEDYYEVLTPEDFGINSKASFPWDEFIAGNLHVKTNRKMIDGFLKDCDAHALKWDENKKATDFNPYDMFEELSCSSIGRLFVDIAEIVGGAATNDSDIFIVVDDEGFLKFGSEQSEDVKVIEII